MIGKTDPIQYNKKSISTLTAYGDLESHSLPSAISVFFGMFLIKMFSKFIRVEKYDLTMVTFNSWTDTRQISAAPTSDSENWKSGSTFRNI